VVSGGVFRGRRRFSSPSFFRESLGLFSSCCPTRGNQGVGCIVAVDRGARAPDLSFCVSVCARARDRAQGLKERRTRGDGRRKPGVPLKKTHAPPQACTVSQSDVLNAEHLAALDHADLDAVHRDETAPLPPPCAGVAAAAAAVVATRRAQRAKVVAVVVEERGGGIFGLLGSCRRREACEEVGRSRDFE